MLPYTASQLTGFWLFMHIQWHFVAPAEVEGVGVFDGGYQRGLDPATVAAVAGVVGKPEAVNGADDVVIETAVSPA